MTAVIILVALMAVPLKASAPKSNLTNEDTFLTESKIPTTPSTQVLGDITGDNYEYWLVILEKYPEMADLLMCLCEEESGCQQNPIPGDNGLAHSWYQIHYIENGITKECAYDFMCATDWTANEIKIGNSWKWPNTYPKCQ